MPAEGRRAVPDVRRAPGPGEQAAGAGPPAAAVPALLPLPAGPGRGAHARPPPDVAAVRPAGVPERPGVAVPAVGQGRRRVRAAGQLPDGRGGRGPGQELLDAQLRTDWPGWLGRVAAAPTRGWPRPWRWRAVRWTRTGRPSRREWATDVMFKDRAALAAVYPNLVRHGMLNLSCRDVMRFLGRKAPAHGGRQRPLRRGGGHRPGRPGPRACGSSTGSTATA